jgi:hypothetical protein
MQKLRCFDSLFLNRDNYILFTKKVNAYRLSSQHARHFGVSLKIGKEIGLEKNVFKVFQLLCFLRRSDQNLKIINLFRHRKQLCHPI